MSGECLDADEAIGRIMEQWQDVLSEPPSRDYHCGYNQGLVDAKEQLELLKHLPVANRDEPRRDSGVGSDHLLASVKTSFEIATSALVQAKTNLRLLGFERTKNEVASVVDDLRRATKQLEANIRHQADLPDIEKQEA